MSNIDNRTKEDLLNEINQLKDELAHYRINEAELMKLTNVVSASEIKYKSLFDNQPLPYQSLNMEGKILDVNAAWLQLLGYKREEVIGKFIGDFIPTDYLSVLQESSHKLFEQGYVKNVEYIIKHKSGRDVFILSNGYIVHNSDGEFKQAYCIFNDITQIKELSHNLDIKERQFSNLMEYASDGVFIGDANGDFIFVNNAAKVLTGYSQEELLKMNMKDLFSKKTLKEKPLCYEILDKGRNIITERWLEKKDGNSVFVEMNSNRMFDGNYLSVIRDESQRVEAKKKLFQSEERFRSIVEHSFEGIGLINQQQIFTYCNDNLAKILGYEKEEVIGSNFVKYIRPEDLETVKQRFQRRITGKEVINSYRFCIVRKDGSIRHVENSASLYFNEDGYPQTIAQIRDITEEINQEKRLLHSENKFRSMIENSFEGIGLIDDSFKFTYANQRLADIAGVGIKEFIGDNFMDFLTPESMELVSENYRKRQAGEEVPNMYEFTALRKDGTIRNVEISSSIILNIDNKKQTLIQINDITERKKTEVELQKSEEKFKALFNGISDAVFVFPYTEKGYENFIEVNEVACKLYGYSEDEFKKINATHLTSPNIKNKRDMEINRVEIYEDKWITFESEHLKKNGELFLVEITSQIFIIDNQKVVISAIRDISERKKSELALKQSEERYRRLFEFSPDPIIIHDGKTILDINTATVKAAKLKDKSELIGQDINLLLHFEDKEKAKARLQQQMETHRPLPAEEMRIVLNNNEIRDVLVSPTPILIDGEYRFMVTFHDITESKQIAQKLQQSEERFKHLSNLTFEGIIIHENGKAMDVNLAMERISGYSRDEILGKNIMELFVHTEDKSLAYENISKNHAKPYEVRGIHKDGHIVFAELESRNIQIDDKQIRVTAIRDISERIKAKEALKTSNAKLAESENMLMTFINSIPDIVCYKDGDGRWLLANDADLELFSLKGVDYFNKTDAELAKNTHKIYEDAFLNCIESDEIAWEKGQISNAIERIPTIKGETKIYDVFKIPVFHADGSRKGLAVIGRDITSLKKIQENLSVSKMKIEESEKTFKAIFDTAITSIYILNKEGIFIDVNHGAELMYGYTKEELIGKSPAFVSAEGKNDLEKIKELNTLAYNGEPQEFEFWGRRKNGEVFPKIVKVSQGTYFGQRVIFAFSMDITERKKNEEIQRILYNISTRGASANLEGLIQNIQMELGKIIDTSNFYVALYNKKENNFTFPFYSDEKDHFIKADADKTLGKYVMETRKPLLANRWVKEQMVEDGLLLHQGTNSKVWMGAPLIVEDKVLGVVAVQSYHNTRAYSEVDLKIFSFVSDQIALSIQRKMQEESLSTALEKATESDRLKSAFLANMSHEIRTPMNGILGFSTILKDRSLDSDEQQKYVDIIEKSGRRLLNIINDLIDISKIEAGQMKMSIISTNIVNELKDVFAFFKHEATQKGISFELQIPKIKKALIIDTDPDKFEAIITNMVKNAIKYTHDGEIKLGLKLGKKNLRIYVKDTGIGVPKDRQKAIFDRFVQADIEDRNVYEGAGLGLAISKAYAHMIGGEIGVESVEGKGSTFYFTIPIGEEVAKIFTEEGKDIIGQKLHDLNDLKILIAEDEEFASKYLEILLRKISKEIINVKTGIETVEACRENPDIDLVLMDIRMPKMDGYEATRQIRKFNKDLIIIAQTANAMSGDREKSLAAGCNDYVSKPVNGRLLLEMIDKYISRNKS